MSFRSPLSDLRGALQLACDATLGVTGVVEQVHGTILRLPLPLGPMRRAPDAGPARLVYASIRGTTRLVDRTLQTALAPLVEGHQAPAGSPERDALVAALNGVAGDFLARTRNPLAMPMELRRRAPEGGEGGDRPRRWLLLVHGLCMNDRQWRRKGHDHGQALARDLALSPVYLNYNSGLGVADNGALLSDRLERFVALHAGPADELVVLGYSMGGLVVRSALATARESSQGWPSRLRQLVFLGTPHLGAPLAAGGHALDRVLGLSPYSTAFSRLGLARSRGLKDLRLGLGPRLAEAPPRVATFALAGALSTRPGARGEDLLGDGLVSVSSALAGPSSGGLCAFAPERRWVARGVGHLDLLSDPTVHARLRDWLS